MCCSHVLIHNRLLDLCTACQSELCCRSCWSRWKGRSRQRRVIATLAARLRAAAGPIQQLAAASASRHQEFPPQGIPARQHALRLCKPACRWVGRLVMTHSGCTAVERNNGARTGNLQLHMPPEVAFCYFKELRRFGSKLACSAVRNQRAIASKCMCGRQCQPG